MRRACLWLPQRQNYTQSCLAIIESALRKRVSTRCLHAAQVKCHSETLPGDRVIRSWSGCSNTGPRMPARTISSISSRLHSTIASNENRHSEKSLPISTNRSEPLIPLSRRQRKDIQAWLQLLDKYLPAGLRTDSVQSSSSRRARDLGADVPKILSTARKPWNTGQDLLAHMILNSRIEAAMYFVDALLMQSRSPLSSTWPAPMPSNINWPSGSLTRLCGKPIELVSAADEARPAFCTPEEAQEDPRYASYISGNSASALESVWFTLGTVITECADLPMDQASHILHSVQLILGTIHNLDLVPKNVYDYRLSPLNATVQRPPILHLVSSRVLTALSDAAWRKQQDERIKEAASLGVSYRDIGKDPPGGRFRLKVRPLPAEVWLEFVLWCCAEAGFVSTGARLIVNLRQRFERPWFGVTWSSRSGAGQTSPSIYWDRIKVRQGGAVGLVEGYSREEPLVQVPPLTISTEVVLALVDANIDCVSRGDQQKGLRVGSVIDDIVNMIEFLEPHDLPIGYFDYLAVRLLQSDAIDTSQDKSAMYNWYKKLVYMKSLVQAYPQRASKMAYDLQSLSSHSELFAGILHQAMEKFVQAGDVHRGLESFNALQELVDQSKLQAIDVFLRENMPLRSFRQKKEVSEGLTEEVVEEETDANNVTPSNQLDTRDFTGSHGHLPLHKLASLLDLTTDTTLVGFGQWLLYSNDPDGPLISPRAYAHPAMARVLLRFAVSSGDRALVSDVRAALKSGRLKPTVRVLRARVNTSICLLEFDKAREDLYALRNSKGGGAGLGNFAYVAATLWRLENKSQTGADIAYSESARPRAIRECVKLLEDMLEGMYQNRGGDFLMRVGTRFNQQMAAILKIFQFDPESILASETARYRTKFRAGNNPHLVPAVFNILLEAIVEIRGAVEGVRFWEMYRTTPDKGSRSSGSDPLTETDVDEDELGKRDLEDDYRLSPRSPTQFESAANYVDNDPYLPMLRSEESTSIAEEQHVWNGLDAKESQNGHLPPPETDSELTTVTIEDFERTASGFFPSTLELNKGSEHQEQPDSDALVIATVRSLQIIVRRAVQQWHTPTSVSPELTAATGMEILEWAAQKFESLGAPADLAYVEVRRPLDQSDIKEQLQPQMESPNVVTRMLSRTRKPTGRNLKKRKSEVQRMFMGQNETRALGNESEVS